MFGRTILAGALIIGALVMPIAGHAAGVGIGVSIDIAQPPPPARVEALPPPQSGYIWSPGYWQWQGQQHVWMAGHWIKERRGYHWVPEHWVQIGPNWHFVAGHWAKEHGEGAAVLIGQPPPPPQAEAVPPPYPGYVWIAGFWSWQGNGYVWVSGHWVPERPGFQWIPEHWVQVGLSWHFEAGRWEEFRGVRAVPVYREDHGHRHDRDYDRRGY